MYFSEQGNVDDDATFQLRYFWFHSIYSLAASCSLQSANVIHRRYFPRLLSLENRRKIESKEIPWCLIPRQLVVFTRQLEILATTLTIY